MNLHYPAEWEKQKAIWLAFPHNTQNWTGKNRDEIFAFYYELIGICARFQPVNVLVPEDFALPALQKKIFSQAAFKPKFIPMQTDDVWIRDYGPFFVFNDNGVKKIVKFQFNAWGAKFPPWENDEQIPFQIAKKKRLAVKEFPYIFEGGAIEVNDDGLGITTLPCLVGKNRNHPKDIKHVEFAIKDALGLKDLLVLPEGLAGDHTDGHIDNAARFVSRNRIAMAWEDDQSKENFLPLQRNKVILETWIKRHYGSQAQVDAVQIPTQKKWEGNTLPASYMNFIFLNGALVYPKYEEKFDKKAEAYFKKVFPNREIIGIDCSAVIREGGSLHCISKQENESFEAKSPRDSSK